jgi:hypothetical protein
VIKSRNLRWTGDIIRVGDVRNVEYQSENLKGCHHEDAEVNLKRGIKG